MDKNKSNPYVEFYDKHKISPVHQDITDINIHLKRREKLYRMLGLPVSIFKNKSILEIGPGGGYNSIAFFKWGANVDFVEPNPTAQKEIPELMNKYCIQQNKWNLYNTFIEDYECDKKYDIIIAESFIQGLHDREPLISKVVDLLNPGGIIVVTCGDSISTFFECLKRIVAVKLTDGIEEYKEKIKILCDAFGTHLQKMKFASRPIEDYVADVFINPNPSMYVNSFGVDDCIKEFGDNFDLLGSSPNIFTEYSWYKDLNFNNSENVLKQFSERRHLFFITNLDENRRAVDKNKELLMLTTKFISIGKKMEKIIDKNVICKEIINCLEEIKDKTYDINNTISNAISEAILLLDDINLEAKKVANANDLASTFGHGQQYVSMIKKFTK